MWVGDDELVRDSSGNLNTSKHSKEADMDPQLAGLENYNNDPVPPQQEVDEFLRKKRKAREHKACYPCRQRKVK